MKDPNDFMTGKGEPAWSLPMNRTELIARCESLAADKAELLRILGVADERIKALEALNSRLANDINCGELLTAPETLVDLKDPHNAHHPDRLKGPGLTAPETGDVKP